MQFYETRQDFGKIVYPILARKGSDSMLAVTIRPPKSERTKNLKSAQWMNTSTWAVSQAKVGKGRIRTADPWIMRPKHYH